MYFVKTTRSLFFRKKIGVLFFMDEPIMDWYYNKKDMDDADNHQKIETNKSLMRSRYKEGDNYPLITEYTFKTFEQFLAWFSNKYGFEMLL